MTGVTNNMHLKETDNFRQLLMISPWRLDASDYKAYERWGYWGTR